LHSLRGLERGRIWVQGSSCGKGHYVLTQTSRQDNSRSTESPFYMQVKCWFMKTLNWQSELDSFLLCQTSNQVLVMHSK
jgi:hypothetical protein